MNTNERNEIRNALADYVARYKSQNAAAKSLEVSAATVSSILKGKDEMIGEEMWRKMAAKVGVSLGADADGWKLVDTTAAVEMQHVLNDAQTARNVTWVVGEAGCGKTTMARQYEAEHREVFYVLCSGDMNRYDFVRETARRVGMRTEGLTMRDMLNGLTAELVQMDVPLLIFDEADKLTERVFHYFIDLYNRLEDRCGMVFFSTAYIKRRMTMGLRYDKKGYNEIHSRIGRKFYDLEHTTATDVYAICKANGIEDKEAVMSVVRDAEQYDYDLRRVKKAVHREQLKQQA